MATTPNLVLDGYFGYLTALRWQQHLAYMGFYYGYHDGDFGPVSQAALQKHMDWAGHYPGLIDGDFGPMSRYGFYEFLVHYWGSGKYVARGYQEQRYACPWDSRNTTAGYLELIQDSTRAVQSGLNRHGYYV